MMTAMRAFLTCPGPLIPVPDSHSISIVHDPTSFAYTDTVLKERRRKRLSQPHQDTPLTPGCSDRAIQRIGAEVVRRDLAAIVAGQRGLRREQHKLDPRLRRQAHVVLC